MSGPIGLHGGGEYLPGDERFLDALLEVATSAALERDLDVDGHAVGTPGSPTTRATLTRPLRIVVLPTAAARGRPDLTAATGRAAFERRATAGDHGRVDVSIARVVDASSAADHAISDAIRRADLIHLPGGDPDLIPTILAGSRALAALESAWRAGAVIAGASAGAMALAEWTWTSGGGLRGLGLVRGLAVVPHYDDVRRTRWQVTLDELAPGELGYLGLDEQTGVIAQPSDPTERTWLVAGQGSAHWFARGATAAVTGRHGDLLRLPA